MTVSHPSQNFAFVQREPKTQLKTRITRGDVPRHLNHRFSPGLRHSPQNGQQLQLPLSTRARCHALGVGGVCLKTGSNAEARCYAVAMRCEKISITSFCPCGQRNETPVAPARLLRGGQPALLQRHQLIYVYKSFQDRVAILVNQIYLTLHQA